jgi:hypothetical protein
MFAERDNRHGSKTDARWAGIHKKKIDIAGRKHTL